jgi:PPP family 3-phenylpropionic acid transporter
MRSQQPENRTGEASAGRLGGMRSFYFAAFGAIGLTTPYFPLWLEAHGFRGLRMSTIAALSPAFSIVGPPLAGALSDVRGGRGNLLSWACGASALAMAALCLAEALEAARWFALVFLCVLGFALCRSPIILLGDRIALESGGNYGRRRVYGSIGFLLAASGFGRFCPPESARWLPGVVAGALALACLASLRLPRVSTAPLAPAFRHAWRLLEQRPFRRLLLCSAVFAASHASYDLCGSLLFRDLGASGDTIGLLWGTGVVAEIVLLRWAAPLFRRARPERLLVLAYGGGALRWFAMSALPRPMLAFWVQPLHAISFGLVWLSSLEVLRRHAEPSVLGGAQGLWMGANAIAGTLGILAFGPLYAALGGAGVFRVATGLALVALVLGSAWWLPAPEAGAVSAHR